MNIPPPRRASSLPWLAAGLGLIGLVTGCGATANQAASGTIAVVAAENEYGSVAAQIGGKDVVGDLDREQSEHRPAHV